MKAIYRHKVSGDVFAIETDAAGSVPLLDGEGQVVGLVVAKLDEIAAAQVTGSLPQNVNYALKSSFVLGFWRRCRS